MTSSTAFQRIGDMLRGLGTLYGESDDERLATLVANGHVDRFLMTLTELCNAYSDLPGDIQANMRRISERISRFTANRGSSFSEIASLNATFEGILTLDADPQSPATPLRAPASTERSQQASTSVLRDVLDKLVPLKPEELNDDDLTCNICQQPFMTTADPEMPLKLPCGHICGSGCILKWIDPLSQDAHNTCPICRKPVLQPTGPSSELLEWIHDLRAWEAHGHQRSAWAVRAEHLYHTLCDSIVHYIERGTEDGSPDEGDAEDWLCLRMPLVRLINFVTLRDFVAFLSKDTAEVSWLIDNLPDAQAYHMLLAHLVERNPATDEFLNADEVTYGRLSGWHRRIRESRNRLLGGLERVAGVR